MGRLYRTLTKDLTRNETLFHAVLGQFWILVCTEAQASLRKKIARRIARAPAPPPKKRKAAKRVTAGWPQ